MSFKRIRLGDVLELERIPVEVDLDAVYCQIGIRSFGNGIFRREPCTGEGLSKLKYFEVHPDRLVVSNIMAWEGAIGVSTDAEKGCVGSARFLSYRAIGDVDIHYLNYYFQTPGGRLMIRSASTGTVARNQTLSPRNFEKMTVSLPSIEEQRRVARRLNAVHEQIHDFGVRRAESRGVTASLCDAVFKGVLDWKALGGGIRLDLDEVAVRASDEYPIAGVYGFGRGIIERDAIRGSDTKYLRLNRLHAGMLVMSRLKAFEGALTVVPGTAEGRYASPEFPTFSVNSDVLDLSYLDHLCRWPGLWVLLSGESVGIGARRERVSAAKLLDTKVPLPDLASQRRIASLLDKVRDIRNLDRRQDALLAALRPALLDAEFSGQL